MLDSTMGSIQIEITYYKIFEFLLTGTLNKICLVCLLFPVSGDWIWIQSRPRGCENRIKSTIMVQLRAKPINAKRRIFATFPDVTAQYQLFKRGLYSAFEAKIGLRKSWRRMAYMQVIEVYCTVLAERANGRRSCTMWISSSPDVCWRWLCSQFALVCVLYKFCRRESQWTESWLH